MNTLTWAFFQRLQSDQLKLTATQKKLKQYLLDHMVDVGYMSLKELSQNAGVAEVSILNFCKLMGFENFITMREQLREYTRSQMRNLFLQPLPAPAAEHHEALYHYCTYITGSHNEMLRNIDLSQLEQCARTLIDSQNILIFGHDMSKIAADYLASRLTYLHIRSQSANLGDNDTVQMLLAGMGPQDSAVIFSFPPYYMPAEDVAVYVRHCGASLIAIANDGDSPVVTEDSVNFLCMAQNPYFFNSMSVPLHFVEVLAYEVASIMGKKSEDIFHTIDAVGSYFRHNKL